MQQEGNAVTQKKSSRVVLRDDMIFTGYSSNGDTKKEQPGSAQG